VVACGEVGREISSKEQCLEESATDTIVTCTSAATREKRYRRARFASLELPAASFLDEAQILRVINSYHSTDIRQRSYGFCEAKVHRAPSSSSPKLTMQSRRTKGKCT